MSNIHIIDKPEVLESLYPITLAIYESGNSKLALVKFIRDITGYGLKDSKDIVDSVSNASQVLKFWKSIKQISDIRDTLSNCDGCKYTMTDIQSIRNKKLIELGLGSIDDLIGEVADRDIEIILSQKFNYDIIRELLISRYSEISEDKLKLILNIK